LAVGFFVWTKGLTSKMEFRTQEVIQEIEPWKQPKGIHCIEASCLEPATGSWVAMNCPPSSCRKYEEYPDGHVGRHVEACSRACVEDLTCQASTVHMQSDWAHSACFFLHSCSMNPGWGRWGVVCYEKPAAVGKWEPLFAINAQTTYTVKHGVDVSKSSELERSATVTTEGVLPEIYQGLELAASASASLTHIFNQEVSISEEEELELSLDPSHGQHYLWQWVFSVNGKVIVRAKDFAMTAGLYQPPRCLPGYAADGDPTSQKCQRAEYQVVMTPQSSDSDPFGIHEKFVCTHGSCQESWSTPVGGPCYDGDLKDENKCKKHAEYTDGRVVLHIHDCATACLLEGSWCQAGVIYHEPGWEHPTCFLLPKCEFRDYTEGDAFGMAGGGAVCRRKPQAIGEWKPRFTISTEMTYTLTHGVDRSNTTVLERSARVAATATVLQTQTSAEAEISHSFSREVSKSKEEKFQLRLGPAPGRGYLWQWVFSIDGIVTVKTKEFALTAGRYEKPQCLPGYAAHGDPTYQSCFGEEYRISSGQPAAALDVEKTLNQLEDVLKKLDSGNANRGVKKVQEKFLFSYDGSRGAKLMYGDKCVGVNPNSINNGSVVQLRPCTEGQNIRWSWDQISGGDVLTLMADRRFCLDVTDHHFQNGAPLQLWKCVVNDADQDLQMTAVDEKKGLVTLRWKKHPEFYVDVRDGKDSLWQPLEIWTRGPK